MKTKSLYGCLAALAWATSLTWGVPSIDELEAQVRPALLTTPRLELPATAADLVQKARIDVRQPTAISIVRIVAKSNPSATPSVVGAISRAQPSLAETVAAEAAKLQPALAAEIRKAAVLSVPTAVPEPVPIPSSRFGKPKPGDGEDEPKPSPGRGKKKGHYKKP